MNKMKFWFICIFLLTYTILYKFIFVSYSELFQYIINPLIWIILTIISYFLLYYHHNVFFNFKKSIIYRILVSSLLYVILFYTLGVLVGFSNNPYSLTTSGIIVNFFSLLLIISLKELIRTYLVNSVANFSNKYILLIFFLFLIIELDIVAITTMKFTFETIFTLLLNDLLTNVINTLFSIYLVKKGGYLPSILYHIITFIPILIIPIVPKYEWLIPALFKIIFPIFTFIIIEHMLNEHERFISSKDKNILEPKKWLSTFIIITIIITFSLGGFGVKPIVIITGSMKPYISEGDLLIIESCHINDIDVGKIIQYQTNNYTIVHRVVRIYKDNTDIKLITKGDNNNSEDRYPVTNQNLIGCLKYKIPYLGYPTYIIGTIFNEKEDTMEIRGER